MSAEAVSPVTTYFRVCDGVRVRFADTKADSDITFARGVFACVCPFRFFGSLRVVFRWLWVCLWWEVGGGLLVLGLVGVSFAVGGFLGCGRRSLIVVLFGLWDGSLWRIGRRVGAFFVRRLLSALGYDLLGAVNEA